MKYSLLFLAACLKTPGPIHQVEEPDHTVDDMRDAVSSVDARVTHLEQIIDQLMHEQEKLEASFRALGTKIERVREDLTPPPRKKLVLHDMEELVRAAKYRELIDAFDGVELTDEKMLFLRAESYFALHLYRQAIVDYSSLTELFPHRPDMASLLCRIAGAFDALGEKNDAQSFYRDIKVRFPDAPCLPKKKSILLKKKKRR